MKQKNMGFRIFSHTVMMLVTLSMVMPLLLLLFSSITDENTLIVNGYSFFPKKFSLEAYRYIFEQGKTIATSYGITILVTITGTFANVFLSAMLAYPLSLPKLPGRKIFSFIIFFTMLFNGGLVPSYLMWTGMFHIKNTLWALILPNYMLSAMNVLLMRTFFMTNIPTALHEAAQVDGASQFKVFFKIILPLGKPILVTMGLFSGLTYWNDWTNGLYYITNTKLYGIQNFLNKMITDAQFLIQNASVASAAKALMPATSVKMAIAFVAMLPILILYPMLQKYFQEGITLGAVKG